MTLSDRSIFLATVLLSLVVSAWSIFNDDVINDDGILYLQSAQYFLNGDWSAAFSFYRWPFFPLLIAFIAQLTGLEPESAAYISNVLFSVITSVVFVALVRAFGGAGKTLLIAGLVIALHPYLLESRADIVRDHGYWAFYLLSILLFYLFYQTPKMSLALAWCAAMIIATLFRLEGVIFLLLLPAILLLRPATGTGLRCKYFIQAHLLTAIILLGLLGWIISSASFDQQHTGRLYDLITRFNELVIALNTGLAEKTQTLRDSVLNAWSKQYAPHALLGVILMLLLVKFVKVLSPVYFVLLFVSSLRDRFQPPAGTITILIWLGLLNLMVILVFFLPLFFISGRHLVALALICMTIIPFILASIHDRWQRRPLPARHKWSFAVLLLALLIMAGDGLFSLHGSSKIYVRDAGLWLREHVPADASLYTNHQKVHYYSGRWMDEEPYADMASSADQALDEQMLRTWKKERSYEYLALWIDRSSPMRSKVSDLLQLEPLARFENERHNSVLIYRLPPIKSIDDQS